MRDADRERMIQYLWSGDYGDCVHELLTENSDLAETIAERTANTSRPPADAAGRAAYQARRSTRHNFLAGLIASTTSNSTQTGWPIFTNIRETH